jgi:predicted transcriptional regulator
VNAVLDSDDQTSLNKLTLLYVFEAMDIPITSNTIIEMCTSRNTWLTYMDCTLTISQLIEAGFIHQFSREKNSYYNITPDGRSCLDHFYTRIPASRRTEITEYVKGNRMIYRRKQEYYRNYFKNADGTYTVQLKIIDPVQTTLEIKLIVSNRNTAKAVYNKWEDRAAQIYYTLHEELID